MDAAKATPVLECATVEEALEELSKFFAIATMAKVPPGMFSIFIDVQWHRLMQAPDYAEFCMRSVGQHVGHAPIDGEGEIRWVDMYHHQFGTLTAPWFADEKRCGGRRGAGQVPRHTNRSRVMEMRADHGRPRQAHPH